MAEKIQREVLSAEELAQLFGVTSKTIYKNARAGHIPTIKLGRRLFFPKKAIFTWLRTTQLPQSSSTSSDNQNIPLPLKFQSSNLIE